MANEIDIFGEFEDPGETFDLEKELNRQAHRVSKRYANDNRVHAQRAIIANSIEPIPVSPENLARRDIYRKDYVRAHAELFPYSTGLKPFGQAQIESIQRFQRIVQTRGKLVQLEPRGFAKTSRAVNQILLGVLQGDIRFALIVSSALDKANEIMEQIVTELVANPELAKLYPTLSACFRAVEAKPIKAMNQMIDGQLTNIALKKNTIVFPIIPGEVSSGARILVKTKENIRGLSGRVRGGAESGKGERPDFILFDDIQTDKDAASPATVDKIHRNIKRSALFGGSHSKPVRAIMTITPNRPGDVASRFALREPSWEVAQYSMLQKMPKNMSKWEEFSKILLNFDKYKEGDREQAQYRAKQFVIDNYEVLHEGAVPAWEWAYDWVDPDGIEVSAVHHAMILYYEEGEEAFRYECQCELGEDQTNEDDLCVEVDTVLSRQNNTSRFQLPADDLHIVTHIDVNKEILTYVTMSCGTFMRPTVIDYGTWPPQESDVWSKKTVYETLSRRYPQYHEDDTSGKLYEAIQDLVKHLAPTIYERTDGATFSHRYIGVDCNWEQDAVIRALKESPHSSMLIGVQGVSYTEKDTPLMELPSTPDRHIHFHCYTTTSENRAVEVLRMDTNNLKTLVHRGFIKQPGKIGAIKLFEARAESQHMLYATHINNERGRYKKDLKSNRTVMVWSRNTENVDNEYLDNTVGCIALLIKLGVSLRENKGKTGVTDMYDYMKNLEVQDL